MVENKVRLSPKDIYKPFGEYSHGVLDKNSGLLVTSGQLGINNDGTIPNSFSEQTKICFSNILSIIKEANYSIDNILRLNTFVTDRKYFKDYMIIRDSFFKDTLIKPSSTLIVVSGFTKPEFLIEIEVIAQKA